MMAFLGRRMLIGFRSLWLLGLPLLFLLPALTSFPYPSFGGAYSDLTISHYPNMQFLKRSILEWQTIPLWSPGILSGYPFAANPLSGLWYPPGWLALLLPLPLGFNLLVGLHLVWGGLGMYRLLRTEGLVYQAALVGGVIYSSLPKLFAHYGAGHLTLVYAFCWTPWLLSGSRDSIQQDAVDTRSGTIVASGPILSNLQLPSPVVLALIFLADPRWAAYAGILWWGYCLAHSRYKASRHSLSFLYNTVLTLLRQTSLAIMLSAPLSLPLLEYTRLSTRVHLTVNEVLSFSLPLPRLLGLIYPDFGGYHEWTLYQGGIFLILGIFALLIKSKSTTRSFWMWSGILSLFFSLGSQLPFITLLASLPGIEWLRVPSRALFVVGMALAALAAGSVDYLLASPQKRARRLRLGLVAITGFTSALVLGVWIQRGALTLNYVWGLVAIVSGVLWISVYLGARISSRIWLAGLLGLGLLDWGVVNLCAYVSRSAGSVFAENEVVAGFLAKQPGKFRIYSPSYSLPQHTAARNHLELADGVDPLQLAAYVNFMEKATGVPVAGYSVTLPPFAEGDPRSDNSTFHPEPYLLGLINVTYITADYDLPVEGLVLIEQFGETRIYKNMRTLPRAWIQPEEAPIGEQARPVEITSWTPNRLNMLAAGPGLLVLSELAYPGWRVWIDGEPAEMQVVAGLLRGVQLEPGLHKIIFSFHPYSIYIGLILLGSGAVLVWLEQSRRRR